MSRRSVRLRAELLEDRLTPATTGALDPTFGTNGIAVLHSQVETAAVAVAPDGKILVAGTTFTQNNDFAVARLTPDGQLDTSFGGTGVIIIPFDLAGPNATSGEYVNSDHALGVAVQPDGRVVVVGYATTSPVADGDVMAAVRLTADGQLDPSFGSGGKVTVPFTPGGNAVAEAVAIQPDGAIVLAGSDIMGGLGTGQNPATNFAAARLTPGGQLDPSFGSGGKVSVPFPVGSNTVAYADAVALGPDGSIVLAGQASINSFADPNVLRVVDNTFNPAVIRLTPSGQLDTSFGDGGRVRVSFGGAGNSDWAQAVRVLANGRVVVAATDGAFRLTAGGRLDPTYGGTGQVTVSNPVSGGGKATVLADGRIALAQTEFNATAGGDDTRIAGLTADGAVDPSYSGASVIGVSTTALAAQPNGNLILAGNYTQGGQAVARVFGEVVPPAGFVPATTGTVAAGGAADGTFQVLNPTGGSFANAGTVTAFPGFGGNVRVATADVNGDGVPDYIVGAGPGGAPEVTVYDGKTGALLADFPAFESSFTGGVFVAAADLTGDGKADIVVTPDQGGGPRVVIFSISAGSGTGNMLASFFGINDPSFRGGARVAAGDLNADGTPDLAVAAGFLGGPRVALWNGKTVLSGAPAELVNDFFAFPGADATTLRNGVYVAVGDLTGGGADLIFGGGPGGAPRVLALSASQVVAGNVAAAQASPVANFFVAGNAADRGGARVAVTDAGGSGADDLVVGSGQGDPARVRVYTGGFGAPGEPSAFQDVGVFGGAALPDGVYVG